MPTVRRPRTRKTTPVQKEAVFPLVRDGLLLLGGMAGVFHEVVLVDLERPTLLILFAAMMGLPAFFPKGD